MIDDSLRQQRPLHLRVADYGIGQRIGASFMREREPFVVQTEGMEQRGMQVVDAHDLFHGLAAEFVRGTVDISLLEAATGNPQRESLPVVIAAIFSLSDGKAPEFSAPQYD